MFLNHFDRSREERLINKRLVWTGETPAAPDASRPTAAQLPPETEASNEAMRIAERMQSRTEAIPGGTRTVEGKLTAVLNELRTITTRATELGTLGNDILAKLTTFLAANLPAGSPAIDLSDPLRAQESFNNQINVLRAGPNVAKLRELDRGLDVVMLRVDFRKELVSVMDRVQLPDAEKNRIGTALETQLARREGGIDAPITREGFRDLIETVHEMMKYAQMLKETTTASPPATDITHAIAIPSLSIAYPHQNADTAYFNYWSEGGKMYSIDNAPRINGQTGPDRPARVQVFDPAGLGSGAGAWRFLDAGYVEGDLRFTPAQTEAARDRVRANIARLTPADLERMIQNQRLERSFIPGASRNYTGQFVEDQAAMARIFNDRYEEFARVHREGYNTQAGAGGSFAQPLGEMFRFFADRMADGIGLRDRVLATPRVAPAGAPEAPAAAPSATRENAPDRTRELVREGYSENLPWGTFTLAKAAVPNNLQTLTKLRDRAPTVSDRRVVPGATRLDGRLRNLNFEINTANELQINSIDHDQVMLEGTYSILIENTGPGGVKTYERMTLRVQPRVAPTENNIRLESPSTLSRSVISPSPAGEELATLQTPPRGWRYLPITPPAAASVLEVPGRSINIDIGNNNTILFKDPTAAMTNSVPDLRPGNHIRVPVSMTDGTTTVTRTIELTVGWPPDATAGDLRVEGTPTEGGDDRYVLRRGQIHAGDTLVTLARDNPEVQWSVTGEPGNPTSTSTSWFDVDQKTGAVTLKPGMSIDPGTALSDVTLTLSGNIPGKSPQETATRRITVRVENPLPPASLSASDVAPQGLTNNNTLPDSLSGATASSQTIATLAPRRSGIGSRVVDTATVSTPGGVSTLVTVALDSPDGNSLRFLPPVHPAIGNILPPGGTLTLEIKLFNDAGVEIGPQRLTLNIPPITPRPEDAQVVEGGDRVQTESISSGGTITTLRPARNGITRTIKPGSMLGADPVQIEIVNNELRLMSSATAIPITVERILTWTPIVNGVEQQPQSITIRPPETPTPDLAKIIVNRQPATTDTLNWGAITPGNRPEETVAEFPALRPPMTRTIELVTLNGSANIIPNDPTSAPIDTFMRYDRDSNRYVVLSNANFPVGSVLGFTSVVTSGTNVVRQPITITIAAPGPVAEAVPQAPVLREVTDREWIRALNTAKALAPATSEAFMMPVNPGANGPWEIINNGGSTRISRTPAGRFRIEAPAVPGLSTNSVEVAGNELDRAMYMAMQINRILDKDRNITTFNDGVETPTTSASHEYYRYNATGVIGIFSADITAADSDNTTAIQNFPYDEALRTNFISLLNARMTQYRAQRNTPGINLSNSRGGPMRSENLGTPQARSSLTVLNEAQISFTLNNLGNLGQGRYDYFVSYNGSDSRNGAIWQQIPADNVTLERSRLQVTDNRTRVYILRIPKAGTPSNSVMLPLDLDLRPTFELQRTNDTTVKIAHGIDSSQDRTYRINDNHNTSPRTFKINEQNQLIMTVNGNHTNLATLSRNESDNTLAIQPNGNAMTEAMISVIPSALTNRQGTIDISYTGP